MIVFKKEKIKLEKISKEKYDLSKRCEFVKKWAKNHNWETPSQYLASLKSEEKTEPTKEEISKMNEGIFYFEFPNVLIELSEEGWIRYRIIILTSSPTRRPVISMVDCCDYLNSHGWCSVQLLQTNDDVRMISHSGILPAVSDDIFEELMSAFLNEIMTKFIYYYDKVREFDKGEIVYVVKENEEGVKDAES